MKGPTSIFTIFGDPEDYSGNALLVLKHKTSEGIAIPCLGTYHQLAVWIFAVGLIASLSSTVDSLISDQLIPLSISHTTFIFASLCVAQIVIRAYSQANRLACLRAPSWMLNLVIEPEPRPSVEYGAPLI